VCDTPQRAEEVYELLSSPNLGTGCLMGNKPYSDDHTQIPTMMEFELFREEAKEVAKLPGVVKVVPKCNFKPKLFNHFVQTGKPSVANPYSDQPLKDSSVFPHSLIYGTESRFIPNNQFPFPRDKSVPQDLQHDGLVSLTLQDCSNIDVIVVDSGIDATHADFYERYPNQITNVSRVVNFNWGLLKEGDTPIINNYGISYNFLRDTNGHGTACASLAAGTRCGFAKNAKIYSIKLNFGDDTGGVDDPVVALKLVLAFIKAKKQNLFGLDSTRPTVITNSWGYGGFQVNPMPATKNGLDYNRAKLNEFFCIADQLGEADPDWWNGWSIWPPRPWIETGLVGGIQIEELDAYVRSIVTEGGHMVFAAGNENMYLDNSAEASFAAHMHIMGTYPHIHPANPNVNRFYENLSEYEEFKPDAPDGSLNNQTFYAGKYMFGFYNSPGIGVGNSKEEFPAIFVGDVTTTSKYESGTHNGFEWKVNSNWLYDFNTLVGDPWCKACSTEPYLTEVSLSATCNTNINSDIRYNSFDSNICVKSQYSNYGPYVDIYACGNSTHAAKSKDDNNEYTLITLSASPTEKYRYFNGTSAATPIVAGILSTFLAAFPNSTPKQAREWLQKNAAKGNILETLYTDTNVVVEGSNEEQKTLSLPIPKIDYDSTLSVPSRVNHNNWLKGARFYKSNNLIAQAYPLKSAVLSADDASVVYNHTQLAKQQPLNEKPTHAF